MIKATIEHKNKLEYSKFLAEQEKVKLNEKIEDVKEDQNYAKLNELDLAKWKKEQAIIEAETGIEAVDQAIIELYQTGYMHNHMRMYVASICCNIANSHWLQPAKWMYSHLLDGDLASNQLSWQWIAGSFSNKKYFANQDNINTYFRSTQKGTFLDVDYDHFNVIKTPQALTETMKLDAIDSGWLAG